MKWLVLVLAIYMGAPGWRTREAATAVLTALNNRYDLRAAVASAAADAPNAEARARLRRVLAAYETGLVPAEFADKLLLSDFGLYCGTAQWQEAVDELAGLMDCPGAQCGEGYLEPSLDNAAVFIYLRNELRRGATRPWAAGVVDAAVANYLKGR
jgi:hypothetical protein